MSNCIWLCSALMNHILECHRVITESLSETPRLTAVFLTVYKISDDNGSGFLFNFDDSASTGRDHLTHLLHVPFWNK